MPSPLVHHVDDGCGYPGARLSCGDLVLAREPAEDKFPTDPVLAKIDLRWPGSGLSRCELAEGTVRPGGAVVLKVLSQHPTQMVLLDDQQPVEDLAPHIPGGK
jgi:hypothetical protein